MPVIGLISLLSGLSAQALKVLLVLVKGGRVRPSLLFSSGGMPSSHTAVVTSLCFLVAAREGVGSNLFSIVLIFGLYVVFEAAGLRQEVGKQAQLLNELMDELRRTHHLSRHRLRELIGHSWAEVAAGFAWGLLWYLLSRRLGGNV